MRGTWVSGRDGPGLRCPRASSKHLPPPLSLRIGVVCAFVINQHVHEQTGPSAEAVPEMLLSLRGLVSSVPQVSTGSPFTLTCHHEHQAQTGQSARGPLEGLGRDQKGLLGDKMTASRPCVPRSCKLWHSSSLCPRNMS